MGWSTYQTNIFDFIVSGVGNAVITAVAGSGKTTTIVKAMELIPNDVPNVFLAFNKSIAEELKSRGVNARTFHSLCYGALARWKSVSGVTSDKLYKIMRDEFKPDDVYLYSTFVRRLVSLGKQVGVGALLPDENHVWEQIIDHHDLELDVDGAKYDRAIELASELLALNNVSDMVDFDDMLYMPVLFDIPLPKFAHVFVDEGQDTNAIQRAILRKIMTPQSRLFVVGDPAQAIYGFRGADSNSLERIRKEFKAVELPLSVSYRCAKAIVEYAHKWVSHIEPAEGAPEGAVTNLGTDFDYTTFNPEDLVVCRTTRPLVSVAFNLIRKGVAVTIMGREIGESLIRLVKQMRTNDLDELDAKIEMWLTQQRDKALAKGDESKVAALEDKAGCIQMMIDEMQAIGSDVGGLVKQLENMFAPTRSGMPTLTLATVHKAKGLEADRVFWLNSSQCPSKWARKSWQKKQEQNICYVATTRAKLELILIEI